MIDINTGLIINPLNGQRISIADAIRIDLLNSDVKEIANTFLNIKNSCIKLTVREAIQLQVLNPFKNEIHLSATSSDLKINIYEARKRNMILKPLTLSEAFIRNLIQPNGFVRNPINNKYYAFETLIIQDMEHSRMAKKSPNYSSDDQVLQHYVFDFETKHIIDPNDAAKRLLSLTEAINIGLIVPRTFELSLTRPQYRRINLYDAFFNNSHTLNLSLLLYKPEIDNVYVKLVSNLFNKCEYFTKPPAKRNKLAVVLSKRDKIGLIEAMNLKIVDLKTLTYSTFTPDNTSLPTIVGLHDACSKYELIDPEMLHLLATPALGINTIRDCINDLTLLLNKYMVRNPGSAKGEYVQLDSYTGKSIISSNVNQRIKRLITRINVKSYIISLNASVAPPQLHPPADPGLDNSRLNQQAKFKTNTIKKEEPKLIKPDIKPPPPPPSFYFGQNPFNDDDSSISKDSITSVWLPSSSNHSASETKPKPPVQPKPKSYVLDYIVDVVTQQRLSVPEAIHQGILNVNRSAFMAGNNQEISIDEAIRLGYIGTRVVEDKKSSSSNKQQQKSTLTIESVVDVASGKACGILEAIEMGILDQKSMKYRNNVTGQVMSLDEAFRSGMAVGKFTDNCLKINVDKNSYSRPRDEFEKVMFVNLDETHKAVSDNDSGLMKEKRFEEVIDDEENYDELPTSFNESVNGVKKRKNRFTSGLQKNIQERRISSYYDTQAGDKRCTLVINDVRQSAMVEIDGIVHGSVAEEVEAVLGEEQSARKACNRNVRVVDDKMFNGGLKQQTNDSQNIETNVRICLILLSYGYLIFFD